MSSSGILEELWALVASIPEGQCVSYGALGQRLSTPVSGYIVGRWMASAPEGLPWWRVVAKDGSLPINKRGPHLGLDQKSKIESEGIELIDGKVPAKYINQGYF